MNLDVPLFFWPLGRARPEKNGTHMTGFGGSAGGVLGAEAFLKKREETLAVSCVGSG